MNYVRCLKLMCCEASHPPACAVPRLDDAGAACHLATVRALLAEVEARKFVLLS
jgi:hypothetical protein